MPVCSVMNVEFGTKILIARICNPCFSVIKTRITNPRHRFNMKIKNPANLSSAGIVPINEEISKHLVEDLERIVKLNRIFLLYKFWL